MTTEKQQDTHVSDVSRGEHPTGRQTPARGTQTGSGQSSQSNQISQTIQGWSSKLTERFSHSGKRPSQHGSTPPPREHIADLILALGDPEHVDHIEALEKLVKIGSPAVPLLNDALGSHKPWLTSYRAAEALGRIGDGRATGPLIHALHHPHSNVRWSAVRALAQVGDLRALFELRRVARNDHGRTSWGESVAGAAQSALDQVQAQSVWNQSLELIKTAITSVLMILSLILAFSVITTLRDEINQVGRGIPPGRAITPAQPTPPAGNAPVDASGISPLIPATETTTPMTTELEPLEPTEAPTSTPEPTLETSTITGRVLSGANVRTSPSVRNEPIGSVDQGDEIVFLELSPDGMWYRIRLDGSSHADSSRIENPDGSESGWVHRELLSEPEEDVPVGSPSDEEEPSLLETPETTPTPEP
jgi:hypothetical protein